MQSYEYQVIPAPARGEKIRGVKTTADRFAQTLAGIMNTQARNGWEYLRTDTLPSEERVGLTGRQTVYLNLLVFRRPRAEADASSPKLLANPLQKPQETPRTLAPHTETPQAGTAPKLGAALLNNPLASPKENRAPE